MRYILGTLSFVAVSILIWLIYLYAEIRFDINKIINYQPKLTTQFFDKNGDLVANIFDGEHRLYVKYDEIPPKIIEALIAIEDTQYFEHIGINPDAISRAIIKDIKAGALVEGASTLTQQLIKTMILTREKKIIRKIKEVLLSLRLESILTKEEIIERYLNQVYFGHGYYGIKTASLGYFKKELNELNIKEIAILVGLPRAPSFYDPTKNLKFAMARANQVIKRLNTLGWINTQQYKEALAFTPVVFNETLTQNKAPYVIDTALKQLQKDVKDIKSGGYNIELTIDLKAQEIALDALQHGYEKIKIRDTKRDTNESNTKTLNGAIISIESSTGKILALVGGIDYKKSSFNRATQSKRQPGSSIKPFLYQVGLNLGYSTASNLIDISRTYNYKDSKQQNKKWQPKNYEKDYKGLIKFREALVHSRNLATINLVTDIGIDIIYKRLSFFGIKEIPYDLSIALGSFSISPLELSEAYTIFSNNGIKVKPYIIQSITNKEGQKIVFDSDTKYVTSPEQSYLITSVLKDVVTRGTGQRASVKNIDIAGKTGTTNKNIDAWFCGYSPTIQTVVWYGNDDNKPMRRSETGGRSAGPAFSYFYKKYMKLHPELPKRFEKPDSVKVGYINGQKEYYTDTSKLPTIKVEKIEEDQIIF